MKWSKNNKSMLLHFHANVCVSSQKISCFEQTQKKKKKHQLYHSLQVIRTKTWINLKIKYI